MSLFFIFLNTYSFRNSEKKIFIHNLILKMFVVCHAFWIRLDFINLYEPNELLVTSNCFYLLGFSDSGLLKVKKVLSLCMCKPLEFIVNNNKFI